MAIGPREIIEDLPILPRYKVLALEETIDKELKMHPWSKVDNICVVNLGVVWDERVTKTLRNMYLRLGWTVSTTMNDNYTYLSFTR